MPKKKKKSTIYYQKIISLLKDKYQYFLLGLTSVFVIVFVSFVFFPKFNLANSKKNTNIYSVSSNNQTKYYITQEGDYLWKIAETAYGSGFNAYDIAQVNHITDPNNIPPGTKLVLPVVTPKEPTQGDITAIQSEKVTNTQERYTVQLGDSLSKIALALYGDLNAWPTIARANNLPNPEAIEVGMILIIPR